LESLEEEDGFCHSHMAGPCISRPITLLCCFLSEMLPLSEQFEIITGLNCFHSCDAI
jgi:hypothetical protein